LDGAERYWDGDALAAGTGLTRPAGGVRLVLEHRMGADHHTVSLYIKGLRLDRARRDLLDPRLAGRPISAIAYACGFGDLSGFNRAFKQAYAVSPRELRNASTSTAEPRR
jgi:AraC-like DNA-binding protein